MKKSIIISCAGRGTRLGIGTTKALIELEGKPLILRQLEMIPREIDIRIVVGYQAQNVIDVVLPFRKDAVFVFNHDYLTTGTAASLSRGLVGANEMIVAMDGDLLVHPDDFKSLINSDEECVCGCIPGIDNPVLMTLDSNNNVIEFSREKGELEWTGLAQIQKNRLTLGDKHVYQMLEALLPIKAKIIRSKEIDTPNDYKNAVNWVQNGYDIS